MADYARTASGARVPASAGPCTPPGPPFARGGKQREARPVPFPPLRRGGQGGSSAPAVACATRSETAVGCRRRPVACNGLMPIRPSDRAEVNAAERSNRCGPGRHRDTMNGREDARRTPMLRPGTPRPIVRALMIPLASRAAALGPGEAAGGARAGQGAKAIPVRADFVVLVWYRRNDPLGTFQYQVYDVRKREYTEAVDTWVREIRTKY